MTKCVPSKRKRLEPKKKKQVQTKRRPAVQVKSRATHSHENRSTQQTSRAPMKEDSDDEPMFDDNDFVSAEKSDIFAQPQQQEEEAGALRRISSFAFNGVRRLSNIGGLVTKVSDSVVSILPKVQDEGEVQKLNEQIQQLQQQLEKEREANRRASMAPTPTTSLPTTNKAAPSKPLGAPPPPPPPPSKVFVPPPPMRFTRSKTRSLMQDKKEKAFQVTLSDITNVKLKSSIPKSPGGTPLRKAAPPPSTPQDEITMALKRKFRNARANVSPKAHNSPSVGPKKLEWD